ncbi:MAG TPA: YebC/PmpR family DNA-binding transcriptional regulator [Anaerolineaceae bacterium]|nr:YebC/PmpR family DNA-binding transcriptional regulator [Anaerolineaceae bacterium]
MSGHSHWATIKRKKGAGDAKRGQLFTRLTREIVMAAREGGGDADGNARLRIAVEKARAQNMPKDNIERAIKRGTGDSKDGNIYEQIMYEGYGPNGVAVIIECVTENRNRTVADLRHLLSRSGGNLGESGSVAWQFERVVSFTVAGTNDFDKVFEAALEGGADDVTQEAEDIEIVGPVEAFKTLSDALRKANIQIEEGGIRMIPNQEMELSVEQTIQAMRFIEGVEDLDDVQNVYSNLLVTEEALSALESA